MPYYGKHDWSNFRFRTTMTPFDLHKNVGQTQCYLPTTCTPK